MNRVDSPYSVNDQHDVTSVQQWKEELKLDPYRSYLYAYPHKMSYRPLDTELSLAPLWSKEVADTFFLYMHIPFCGARCGFCNLFTLPDKRASVHEQYVDALERQARQWAPFLGDKPVARFAIGGGTPTLLVAEQLDRLFWIADEIMGVDLNGVSISVEVSPETVTTDRLDVLKKRSVDRVSMGIQSFVEAEAAAIYRPQKPDVVERALEQLRRYEFPILNLDLIYGLPGQTVSSWMYSLGRALAHDPQEIFLYPLYTREHTIVKPEHIRNNGDDLRMELYLAARAELLARGYKQSSMRRFAKPEAGSTKQLLPYSCQEEGMLGLGCGARSYTRDFHYATRYGVSRKATESIIAEYVATDDYTRTDYGFQLDRGEQQRRFILKAILHVEGLELKTYRDRFGSEPLEDHPSLTELLQSDLATLDNGVLRLTDEGLSYSDAIGDRFISNRVRQLMGSFELS